MKKETSIPTAKKSKKKKAKTKPVARKKRRAARRPRAAAVVRKRITGIEEKIEQEIRAIVKTEIDVFIAELHDRLSGRRDNFDTFVHPNDALEFRKTPPVKKTKRTYTRKKKEEPVIPAAAIVKKAKKKMQVFNAPSSIEDQDDGFIG